MDKVFGSTSRGGALDEMDNIFSTLPRVQPRRNKWKIQQKKKEKEAREREEKKKIIREEAKRKRREKKIQNARNKTSNRRAQTDAEKEMKRKEEAQARTIEELRVIEKKRGYKKGWAERKMQGRESKVRFKFNKVFESLPDLK